MNKVKKLLTNYMDFFKVHNHCNLASNVRFNYMKSPCNCFTSPKPLCPTTPLSADELAMLVRSQAEALKYQQEKRPGIRILPVPKKD